MRFLADEDVPCKLLVALRAAGHDAVRVDQAGSDQAIAHRAKAERRIIVTLDKDFTNRALYPPSEFTIIHIRIHPPYARDLIEAFMRLLDVLPSEKFHGLIVLQKLGSIQVSE